jgi:hypothetical protein
MKARPPPQSGPDEISHRPESQTIAIFQGTTPGKARAKSKSRPLDDRDDEHPNKRAIHSRQRTAANFSSGNFSAECAA